VPEIKIWRMKMKKFLVKYEDEIVLGGFTILSAAYTALCIMQMYGVIA
jgi:hypothetical protein